LLRWYRDGVDLGVALRVLAAYLGHVSLSGTQRYLQLTAEMHPDLIAALQARHGEIIPRKELP
jgi:site-specific recombinase XerD